jgi:HAD superfamily hydrolase (TIGR01484 family)
MSPLTLIPRLQLSRLRGLAFDLDDTLLDHGRLLPSALDALYRLKAAGFELFAVTGRPASWGAVVAHQWPLDGAVSENGAIAFYREGKRVLTSDPLPPEERAARRAALMRIVAELSRRYPKLVPADDVAGRISDFTFDIGEYQQVPADVVRGLRSAAVALGAAVTTSSVHLHVSLDRADKASGLVRLTQSLFGLDPARALSSYAFIGDSENDAACFAAFRLSVGVANLSGRPTVAPRYRTAGERAAGFVETAELLLTSRPHPPTPSPNGTGSG